MNDKIYPKLKNEKGFSLVEMVIALVILAILLTSASAYFSSIQERINASACKANQLGLVQAQNLYYTYYFLNDGEGKYAENLDDLIPYIQSDQLPECPSLGMYSIEGQGKIKCSLPEHARIN